MTAGFRSQFGIWVGGATAVPPPGGFRSLMAFWTGGASAGTIGPPVPPVARGGGRVPRRIAVPRHQQHLDDDELILIVISSATRCGLI